MATWRHSTFIINIRLSPTFDIFKRRLKTDLFKCQLDPAPTWLVKEMRGLLAPFVALLFNKSLDTGCFPAEFKQAVVRPLLKKSGLDTAEMKNYRPVSILSFLSKLLEKVVQDRLQAFLDSSDLMPPMHTVCLSEVPQH